MQANSNVPPVPPGAVLARLVLPVLLSAPSMAQQSRAVLHAPLVVLPVDSAPFQRLGDFDGDGDLDAVGSRIHGNRTQTEIVVWENQRGAYAPVWSGSYPLGGIASPAPRSLAIAVADFDGDGRDDFVVAGGIGSARFLARPGWSFQTSTSTLGRFPDRLAVATGDFDGDPLADVAIVDVASQGSPELRLERSTGGVLTAAIAAGPNLVPHVTVLELDGAAGDEVLVSDRASPTAWIFAVVGNQLVLQQTLVSSLAYVGSTPWLWMGGDLDGDHDDDLVVFRPELGSNGVPHYEVFRRTGPAAFTAEPQQIGGPAEYLADIDGDGDLDGVCCGGGGGTFSWPMLDFASTFEISTNLGNGRFARAWTIPGAGSESMAGAADVDGDGDVDFVAGRCVFFGHGAWVDDPMPDAGGEDVMIVGRPWLLDDVDGDHDLDFFGRNRGDGGMVPEQVQVAPPAGHQFAGQVPVDVDGDGARDLVVRLMTYNPPNPAVFVAMAMLQNNGGGHYRYAGPVAPNGLMFGGAYWYTVDNYLAADCDGDGDEDVIANGNPAAGHGFSSQIFWNQGGVFAAGPSFSLLNARRIERVADFDGDGRPELLTWNGAGTRIWTGVGSPVTAFVSAWAGAQLLFEPAALVVADLDDDGRLDFAGVGGTGEVVIFRNATPPAGPLQFTSHVLAGERLEVHGTVAAAVVRCTLTAGDFDGDGRTDLALGHLPGEPNVGIVLRRRNTPAPTSLADYDVIRQTFVDGFACDADGDGDTDLVGERAVHGTRYHGRAGGQRLQRHAGVAGEDGATPVLGGSGPYRPGVHEVMWLSGVTGPSIALLGLSLREVELPGVPLPSLTLRVDPTLLYVAVWPILDNGLGRAAARAELRTFIVPQIAGLTFYAQAFVLDASAPDGFAQSNLLEKRIGW